MKSVTNFIEKNSAAISASGIIFGLIFPQFAIFKPYLTFLLMAILFFTFIGIDVTQIAKQLKRIKLLTLIIILQMAVLPLLMFFVIKLFKPADFLLTALLLFTLLPAGAASPAMTGILNGDKTLSAVITIITHFIAPITIPLFFFLLLRKIVRVDYLSISKTLIELIFIPLIAAEIFKRAFKGVVKVVNNISKSITTIILVLLGATVIGTNHSFIINNPWEAIKYILIALPIYFAFMILPFYLTPFLQFEERVSVFATKVFMNVTIGIVLALQFLDTKASLALTLAQIPWNLMIFPASVFVRWQKNNLKNKNNKKAPLEKGATGK